MSEQDDKQWPLLVRSGIDEESWAHNYADRSDEALLRAQFDLMYLTARNMLREAGRLREVRSLKLYCYNYDLKTQQEKE